MESHRMSMTTFPNLALSAQTSSSNGFSRRMGTILPTDLTKQLDFVTICARSSSSTWGPTKWTLRSSSGMFSYFTN